MRAGGGEEESVYRLGDAGAAPIGAAAPRVAQFRFSAPGQKVKMHVDSSQVGPGTVEQPPLQVLAALAI